MVKANDVTKKGGEYEHALRESVAHDYALLDAVMNAFYQQDISIINQVVKTNAELVAMKVNKQCK
jgi:hypothetical protein